jgi:5-methyltetrahydropteroyltriglutamate--homocysteine methyltransferase
MRIEKTVVGSFPKFNRPLEEAIREVVDLQLCYGIDLITDGEQRSNMIQYFDQIPGLEKISTSLRIVGKIKPMKQEMIDEFYKIKDYQTVKSILESKGKENVRIKISLTGPMTLSTICASTDINSTSEHYNLNDLNDEKTLYSDFSQALLPIAQAILNTGAYLQIDEPLLSTGQVSLDVAKEILDDFISNLSLPIKGEKVSCHVCGSIKSVVGLYDFLLDLNIPILSLGFSGDTEKENFDIISEVSLKEHSKKLSAGIISNINIEDEITVIDRYNRIVEKVGKENIRYISPDCGFRMTPLEKVKLILARMKTVADKII